MRPMVLERYGRDRLPRNGTSGLAITFGWPVMAWSCRRSCRSSPTPTPRVLTAAVRMPTDRSSRPETRGGWRCLLSQETGRLCSPRLPHQRTGSTV